MQEETSVPCATLVRNFLLSVSVRYVCLSINTKYTNLAKCHQVEGPKTMNREQYPKGHHVGQQEAKSA
jgi:hypothetical protein